MRLRFNKHGVGSLGLKGERVLRRVGEAGGVRASVGVRRSGYPKPMLLMSIDLSALIAWQRDHQHYMARYCLPATPILSRWLAMPMQ